MGVLALSGKRVSKRERRQGAKDKRGGKRGERQEKKR